MLDADSTLITQISLFDVTFVEGVDVKYSIMEVVVLPVNSPRSEARKASIQVAFTMAMTLGAIPYTL